jgi:hypothetical protein
MWCATYHQKQHDVYYPSMGVVSSYAFSFMSKYLHQFFDQKHMTRVDINDNNQSSNNLLLIPQLKYQSLPKPLFLKIHHLLELLIGIKGKVRPKRSSLKMNLGILSNVLH